MTTTIELQEPLKIKLAKDILDRDAKAVLRRDIGFSGRRAQRRLLYRKLRNEIGIVVKAQYKEYWVHFEKINKTILLRPEQVDIVEYKTI